VSTGNETSSDRGQTAAGAPSGDARARGRGSGHDTDWVRVLAALLLVPFHSARLFNVDPDNVAEPFYVKGEALSRPRQRGRLPLLHPSPDRDLFGMKERGWVPRPSAVEQPLNVPGG